MPHAKYQCFKLLIHLSDFNQMLQHFKNVHTQLNSSLLHKNTHSLVRTLAAPVRGFVAINGDTCGIYWSTAGYEMKKKASTSFNMNIQTIYWAINSLGHNAVNKTH